MRTTASKRGHDAGAGRGMKGIISTLAMSAEGVLAAGTFSRWVGLYDGFGSGGTVAVFPVAGKGQGEEGKGMGITQVLWGSCGRYLCVAERGSDGVGVWDIRGTGKRLAWLKGRKALTQQRLGVEVVGGEVWAGGTDGVVRVWEGLGIREGSVDCAWKFQAHGDAVSSATLHPTGSVLATCSGQRHWDLPESGDGASSGAESDADSMTSSMSSAVQSSTVTLKERSSLKADNSLNIWSL